MYDWDMYDWDMLWLLFLFNYLKPFSNCVCLFPQFFYFFLYVIFSLAPPSFTIHQTIAALFKLLPTSFLFSSPEVLHCLSSTVRVPQAERHAPFGHSFVPCGLHFQFYQSHSLRAGLSRSESGDSFTLWSIFVCEQ